MADLKIIDLYLLYLKVSAAGGTTTASSTAPSAANPSLCPKKSSIAGYVTSGTVTISGTYTDALLVAADHVTVSGGQAASTRYVYKNLSEKSRTVPDMPASGGTVHATFVFNVLKAIETTYSNNTKSVGAYSADTITMNGSDVTLASLGTTVLARTNSNLSSSATLTLPAESGNVTLTLTAPIYRAANAITSYGAVDFNVTVATDAGANGTTKSSAPVISNVTQVRNYTSGSTDSTAISSYTAYYGTTNNPTDTNANNCTFAGSNLGTTIKPRTLITTAYVKVISNSVSAVKSIAVYLLANEITAYGNPDFTITLTLVPASGGNSAIPSVNNTVNQVFTYTSGSTAIVNVYSSTSLLYSLNNSSYGTTSAYYSVNVPSKANNVSGVTNILNIYVKATVNGKSTTKYAMLLQQANAVVSYSGLSITASAPADIAASGGTSNTAPTVSSVLLGKTYTSGYTEGGQAITGYTLTYHTDTNTTWGTTNYSITAASRGTTIGSRQSVGTIYIKATANGLTGETSVDVYQAANTITSYGVPSYSLIAAMIAASGGWSLKPLISNNTINLVFTYSSGSTETINVYASSAITYSLNGSSYGTTSEYYSFEAPSRRDEVGGSKVVGTIYVKATVNGLYKVQTVSIYQNANSATYGTLVISVSAPADISAGGGTNAKPTITSVTLGVTYTSNYSKTITLTSSDYSILYHTSNNSWGASNYSYTVGGNSSTSRVFVGTVYIKITANGVSGETGVNIYQAANEIDISGIQPYVYRYYGNGDSRNKTFANRATTLYFTYPRYFPRYGFTNGVIYPTILYNRIRVPRMDGTYTDVRYDKVIANYYEEYDEVGENSYGIPVGLRIYRIMKVNNSTLDGTIDGVTYQISGAAITEIAMMLGITSTGTITPGIRILYGNLTYDYYNSSSTTTSIISSSTTLVLLPNMLSSSYTLALGLNNTTEYTYEITNVLYYDPYMDYDILESQYYVTNITCYVLTYGAVNSYNVISTSPITKMRATSKSFMVNLTVTGRLILNVSYNSSLDGNAANTNFTVLSLNNQSTASRMDIIGSGLVYPPIETPPPSPQS